MLADALAYPFRRENLAITAVAAGFATVPPLVFAALPSLPYVGILGLIVEAVVLGYLLLFLHSIMEVSTKGDADFPGWPDVTSGSDMMSRVLHVLFPLVVSFLPMIAFWAYVVISGAWQGVATLTPARLWITVALAAGGLVYLPIGMLIFSFYGEWAIFNVIGAVRSIARMPGDYAMVVALIVALFVADIAAAWALARLPSVLAVPLGALAGFYLLAVAMRAVGLLYHRNRGRLGWED